MKKTCFKSNLICQCNKALDVLKDSPQLRASIVEPGFASLRQSVEVGKKIEWLWKRYDLKLCSHEARPQGLRLRYSRIFHNVSTYKVEEHCVIYVTMSHQISII